MHTFNRKNLVATHISPKSSPRKSVQQYVSLKSPRICGQQLPFPDRKSAFDPKMSAPVQCAQGWQWHCSSPRLTLTQLGSWVGSAAKKLCATFTHLCRPSYQVWCCACSSMGTMLSSRPPTGIRNTVPQFWAYPRSSWGTFRCPGPGLVWPLRINVPFTHQLTIIFLASSIISRLYKSQSRFRGIANKTHETHRLYVHYVRLRAKWHTLSILVRFEARSQITKT